MGARAIKCLGAAVLRRPARPVSQFDAALSALLDDLTATMQAAEGVGLAANQIGILRRAIVVLGDEGVVELVNPVLQESSGERVGVERCLSLPGRRLWIRRAARVVVTGQDRFGQMVRIEAVDRLARCLQHEMDHLDGRLIVDRQIHPTQQRQEGCDDDGCKHA